LGGGGSYSSPSNVDFKKIITAAKIMRCKITNFILIPTRELLEIWGDWN
jgi:hypothetical protein